MAAEPRIPSRGRKKKTLQPVTRAKPKKPVSKKTAARVATRSKSAAKPAPITKKKIVPKKLSSGDSSVIPYLTVKDAAASLAFYEHAFGFKRGKTLTLPDGTLLQVVMRYLGGMALKFSPEGIWSGSMKSPATSGAENPIVLNVPCRKVDELTERARAAGATIASEPEDMFWGERIARIVDPDGYVWCFASTIGKFDPDRIPEVTREASPSESMSDQTSEPESQEKPGASLDFEF